MIAMLLHLADVDLHYDLHGDGEPLLWLHGGFGLGSDWTLIFDPPPDGYRVIAPDLRGHGRSDGAQSMYSFRQAAIDAFALLDHLRIDQIKIIGLSGGGITALHMAVLQPMRVASMVVISAPPAFPEQAKAMQRQFSEAMFGADEGAAMRRRHPRPGQLDTLMAQVRRMPDGDDPNFTRAELGAIQAETLIVFGDRDPLYPVSLAVELREAIPHSWLWVVPNGGHGPVFGPSARPFAQMALAFLAGRYEDLPALAGRT
jgi:pimeloyl-ACP methyl ester carboxylesterase